jgi:phosphotransferase system HPr (HPr) family protein
MSDVLQRTVVVTNPQGFHLRPMAAFARLAAGFQSTVTLSREGQDVINGKSILDLMLLQAAQGTAVTVRAEGPDAAAAVEALAAVLAAPGEEEPPAQAAPCPN